MPSDYQAITEYNEDQLGKDTASRKTQVSMYSDSTHFVYEILQNADDHDATEVHFKLSKNELAIEHNGEPFQEKNVRAITYFGKGTSREDLVKTGRFGIGFKSVFAFTATPIIISWPEHFQIYGLYRVKGHPYPEGFESSRTRIILPFNHESENPDFVEILVSPQEAYQQISECLTKLEMNTLLFTRNIREISWEIGNQSARYWREDEIDDNSRLTIIIDGDRENRYLVFSKVPTWENERHKEVEIAFAIDEEHQITSIDDDNLYVLFPTTEKTGLRFLLNGPYRTNPARETVSKTDAFNVHLMKVTCELMKELLPQLRERKLLTVEFLSILPNKEDEVTHKFNWLEVFRKQEKKLRGFYTPLHDTIVHEFRNQKLTPTKQRNSYAPAKNLYRSTREMYEVIRDDDLATLLGKDHHLPLWVKNLPPRGRDDRGRFVEDENATKHNKRINDFLDTLDIPKWDVQNLIKALESEDELIIEWLKQKPDEWHQDFYAFLDDSPSYYEEELSELSFVRCIDGQYRIGSECHFSGDDVEPNEELFTVSTVVDDGDQSDLQKEEIQEENFHYVDPAVYSFGINKKQQESARKFLETIGVKEVDEIERIKVILKNRYSRGSIKPREGDMERFIDLVKNKPESKSIFKDSYIFEIDLQQDNSRWFRKPDGVFLDSPYLDTGLTAYYEIIDEDVDSFKRALSPNYVRPESGLDPVDISKFSEAVGAQTKLKAIELQNIPSDHPEREYLYSAPGEKESKRRIIKNYQIPEFSELLNKPSISKSNLIWQTMKQIPEDNLEAQYRKSASYESRYGYSSLVHDLRKAKWVPQKNGDTVSFVRPCNALVELLPKGFAYEPDQEWLKAIEFGKKTNGQRDGHAQRNQNAKEFGYDSSDEAEEVAAIYMDWKAQGKSTEELHRIVTQQERRTAMLIVELDDSHEKEYEHRARNVRVSRGKIDPVTPLRTRYALDGKNMNCQMCKQEMPFKKRNSDNDYFEAVEGLRKDHFPKEHEAQYLALCPVCSAKYKEYVKKDPQARKTLYNTLKDSNAPEVSLHVNGETIHIWFEEKHWHDLKTVIYYYENIYSSENSSG